MGVRKGPHLSYGTWWGAPGGGTLGAVSPPHPIVEVTMIGHTNPQRQKTKKLYAWDWVGGGYNQCHAFSKREARKIGNAMRSGLVINEASFRLVRDEKSFWDNYPRFD